MKRPLIVRIAGVLLLWTTTLAGAKFVQIAMLLCLVTSGLPAAEFVTIGSGTATDLSADGSVVSFSSEQGWIWRRGGGLQALGMESAAAISGDGTAVVGTWSEQGPDRKAGRWTEATGVIPLSPDGSRGTSYAADTSYDGSVVVGKIQVDGGYPGVPLDARSGHGDTGDTVGMARQ